jgi:MFS family permease
MPTLPRRAWLVLGGDALSAIGTGMTLPFLVIYLHNVRGISLGVSGAAVSTVALAGFIGNPLGGWMADRVGPRPAVVAGLVVSAAGTVALTLVHEAWQAFPAAAVVGFGVAVVWPAQDSLLAVLVAPEQRPAVFSIRHGTMNAGLAVGGLAAAAIVRDTSASRFVLLYLVDAATFLAFIPVLALLRGAGGRAPSEAGEAAADGGRVGMAAVMRDPVFRRVWLLTAALVALGYAQFNSTFPAFAGRPDGIAAGAIGLVFAANTVAVVGFQLVALRLLAGRRRTTALALTCGCWAAAWACALVAGAAGSSVAAVAGFAVAAVVFALGETFMSPTIEPIVNDLATDELRGRYNGLSTLAWTTGFAAGPVVGGLALGAGREGLFFVGLVVGCALLVLASLRLARHLPANANVIGEGESRPPVDGAVVALTGEMA